MPVRVWNATITPMCVLLTAWAPGRWGFLLGATPNANDIVNLFVMFAVVAAVALGGLVVAAAIRRWSQKEEHAATFTFQDLREMRARGDISEAEFQSMRAALLAELDLSDERLDDDSPPAPGT